MTAFSRRFACRAERLGDARAGETFKEFVDKDQSYFIEMTLINDSVVCSTSTPTLGECIEYSVEC